MKVGIRRLRIKDVGLDMAPEVIDVIREAGLSPEIVKNNRKAIDLILLWRSLYIARPVLINALRKLGSGKSPAPVRLRMRDV